jgi:DNA-binding response OmpR family regulator
MKKILFVEDDELILKMVEFKLKKEGYLVSIAKDGNAAIENFNSFKPDIVVTDIMMPFKSGLEITYLIKKAQPDIPVIILSALGEDEASVQKAFQLGANDFIAKPFSPNELILRISRFV